MSKWNINLGKWIQKSNSLIIVSILHLGMPRPKGIILSYPGTLHIWCQKQESWQSWGEFKSREATWDAWLCQGATHGSPLPSHAGACHQDPDSLGNTCLPLALTIWGGGTETPLHRPQREMQPCRRGKWKVKEDTSSQEPGVPAQFPGDGACPPGGLPQPRFSWLSSTGV